MYVLGHIKWSAIRSVMIITHEISFANDSKLEAVNYPNFLVRVKVKQIYAVLQFNQNNGIELAEEQTKQSRTLHSYGIVYNIIIQKRSLSPLCYRCSMHSYVYGKNIFLLMVSYSYFTIKHIKMLNQ